MLNYSNIQMSHSIMCNTFHAHTITADVQQQKIRGKIIVQALHIFRRNPYGASVQSLESEISYDGS